MLDALARINDSVNEFVWVSIGLFLLIGTGVLTTVIPNLIGVIVLSGTVRKITKNYIDRKLKGKSVEPMLSAIPEIQAENAKKIAE